MLDKNLKSVIFDFDGTIADSLGILLETYNELSDHYGYKKAKSLDIFKENTTWEFFTKVLKVPLWSLPVYYFRAKRKVGEKIDKVNMFGGMDTVLNELSGQYILGLLTSNFESNIQKFLIKKHLNTVFKYIYPKASQFRKHKALYKFLNDQKFDRQNIIYVGDEVRDVRACKKAGVKIIAVTWGFDSKKLLKSRNPDYLVEEPRHLLDILEK